MTAQFPNHRRPHAQSGQALVLTIAFSAVTAVMVLYLFSTAQLTNQKTKLQNTADAAAFSSGVLQARDYNFSAYTNRAMVANHVAVAQFVGLDSWTEELEKEFKADPCLPPPIPFTPLVSKCSGAFAATTGSLMWNTQQSLALRAANVSRRLFNAEKPLARILEPVIEALSVAQTAYHGASLAQFTTGVVVDGVVKANDPAARISRSTFNTVVTAREIVDWQAFAKSLNTQPGLKRFANVTVDSAAQDGFTRSRKMLRLLPTAPQIPFSFVKPYICPLADVTGLTMEMTHGGGTQMSQDMAHWFAIDSAGVVGMWGCLWSYGPIEVGFLLPITSIYMDFVTPANGGSMAGRSARYAYSGYSSPTNSYYGYGQIGGALIGPGAPAGLLKYARGPGSNVAANYRGMRAYQEVASFATTPTRQTDAANIAPTLSIEIQKDGANIRTAANVLPGNNMLKLNDGLKSNMMRVVSSSQAYFMRPHNTDHRARLNAGFQRGDNKTEFASLYNPYWQARLVATPQVNVDLSSGWQ